MAKGWMDLLLDSIFDAEWTGRHGERLTANELNFARLFGYSGKVLRNVYVPKDNGETSEIDVVFITRKGIFVIESKNYSGWIFGDEKSRYWTAMLPNREKNKFYNPIMQNRSHIKWLGEYLKEDIPLFSLVVFSERCELKKVSTESRDVRVIKRDRLYANVRDIWENSEDKLDDLKVKEVCARLEFLTHADRSVKELHIEQIDTKYKKAEAVPEIRAPEKPAVCPRCGGNLILRVAKKGENAGKSFYGCSNFPKCRYVRNVGE